MAECCCWLNILFVLITTWLVWVLFLHKFIQKRKQAWFVGLMIKFAKKSNTESNVYKKKIFEALHKMAAENGGRPLKIVEVGAGAGSNFLYLPEKSEITCYDPIIDAFQKDLLENACMFPSIKMESKCGKAEDMSDIESESQDACLCIHVLCSADDVKQCFREMFRILKPGGKLIFYEHIQAEPNTWMYFFQHVFRIPWKLATDCELTLETEKIIPQVGFSSIEMEVVDTPDGMRKGIPFLLYHFLKMTKRKVIGSATK